MSQEPKWLTEARKHIGLTEVKGAAHNAEILKMWKDIKRAGIKDDETPWCAAFVGSMLERSGVRSTRFESAKSYLQWGYALTEPLLGCIVVFSRDGGGHVGFLVGYDEKGNLLILGGNQSDGVNIRSFPVKRATGYRYPDGLTLQAIVPPVIGRVAPSTTEA
jgi:uncharacterized protein (TIGR02594 family)